MRRIGLLLLLLCACTRAKVVLVPSDDAGTDAGSPEIAGLLGLSIDPPAARVVIDGTAPPLVAFRAIGTFAGGDEDVSDRVQWRLERDLGTIENGAITLNGIGGETKVVAEANQLSATAVLSIAIDVVLIGPGAPGDAPSRFPLDTSGDITGPQAPLIVYPSDQTMFPLNFNHLLHQWRAGPSQDLFEVRFDSNAGRVRYYTTDRTFLLDDDERSAIIQTNAGRTVTVTVRGRSPTSTAAVHRSEPIAISYSESEVLGAIYYWSTGAKGVLRAGIGAPIAIKFYDEPSSGKVVCVSCHTVSRDGRRLAAGYDGERLRVVSIPEREVLVPKDPGPGPGPGPEAGYGWGTFNPGATQLLYADKGMLHLLDVDTGDPIRAVPLPPMTFATHPDWSPDGAQIAVAVVTDGRAPGNKEVKGSSLGRMMVQADGSFGPVEILVASDDPEDTLCFPSHSPDSRWLAFVRTRGRSKDSRASEIWLVRSDGSAPPIAMERLNRSVRHELGIRDIGNSMPTWAPTTKAGSDWLAFSSVRAYGDVLVGPDLDQLWGAAVDLDRAAAGLDPSAPAFWMPFQSVEEGNHRAYWALAGEDPCPSTIEICDALDNDCDGIVDEECCAPVEETCGNAIDDDCDGAPDDGCGCAAQEICNNGIDDDCDELLDLADEDCAI